MITDDMPNLEDLRYHDIYRLHTAGEMSAMDALRFAVWHEGGLWDSPRALRYLLNMGWETAAKYPLNLAGNMLARMVHEGSAVRKNNGEYVGVPDVVERILRQGKRKK